jgi:hypothetical protein
VLILVSVQLVVSVGVLLVLLLNLAGVAPTLSSSFSVLDTLVVTDTGRVGVNVAEPSATFEVAAPASATSASEFATVIRIGTVGSATVSAGTADVASDDVLPVRFVPLSLDLATSPVSVSAAALDSTATETAADLIASAAVTQKIEFGSYSTADGGETYSYAAGGYIGYDSDHDLIMIGGADVALPAGATIGGALTVVGDLTVGGAAIFSGDAVFGGDLVVTGDLHVADASVLGDGMTVSGPSLFEGGLSVTSSTGSAALVVSVEDADAGAVPAVIFVLPEDADAGTAEVTGQIALEDAKLVVSLDGDALLSLSSVGVEIAAPELVGTHDDGLTIATAADLTLSPASGTLVLDSPLLSLTAPSPTISAAGDLALVGADAVNITAGGDITLEADGDVVLSHGPDPADHVLVGSLKVHGSQLIADGTPTAISSVGDLTFTAATGDLVLEAASDLTLSAAGSITITGGSSTSVVGAVAFDATATGPVIRPASADADSLTVQGGDASLVLGPADATLSAAGDLYLSAGDLSDAASTADVVLSAGGTITFDTTNGVQFVQLAADGTVDFDAGAATSFFSPSAPQLSSDTVAVQATSGDLTLTSAGTIQLGTAASPADTVSLTADTVHIAAGDTLSVTTPELHLTDSADFALDAAADGLSLTVGTLTASSTGATTITAPSVTLATPSASVELSGGAVAVTGEATVRLAAETSDNSARAAAVELTADADGSGLSSAVLAAESISASAAGDTGPGATLQLDTDTVTLTATSDVADGAATAAVIQLFADGTTSTASISAETVEFSTPSGAAGTIAIGGSATSTVDLSADGISVEFSSTFSAGDGSGGTVSVSLDATAGTAAVGASEVTIAAPDLDSPTALLKVSDGDILLKSSSGLVLDATRVDLLAESSGPRLHISQQTVDAEDVVYIYSPGAFSVRTEDCGNDGGAALEMTKTSVALSAGASTLSLTDASAKASAEDADGNVVELDVSASSVSLSAGDAAVTVTRNSQSTGTDVVTVAATQVEISAGDASLTLVGDGLDATATLAAATVTMEATYSVSLSVLDAETSGSSVGLSITDVNGVALVAGSTAALWVGDTDDTVTMRASNIYVNLDPDLPSSTFTISGGTTVLNSGFEFLTGSSLTIDDLTFSGGSVYMTDSARDLELVAAGDVLLQAGVCRLDIDPDCVEDAAAVIKFASGSDGYLTVAGAAIAGFSTADDTAIGVQVEGVLFFENTISAVGDSGVLTVDSTIVVTDPAAAGASVTITGSAVTLTPTGSDPFAITTTDGPLNINGVLIDLDATDTFPVISAAGGGILGFASDLVLQTGRIFGPDGAQGPGLQLGGTSGTEIALLRYDSTGAGTLQEVLALVDRSDGVLIEARNGAQLVFESDLVVTGTLYVDTLTPATGTAVNISHVTTTLLRVSSIAAETVGGSITFEAPVTLAQTATSADPNLEDLRIIGSTIQSTTGDITFDSNVHFSKRLAFADGSFMTSLSPFDATSGLLAQASWSAGPCMSVQTGCAWLYLSSYTINSEYRMLEVPFRYTYVVGGSFSIAIRSIKIYKTCRNPELRVRVSMLIDNGGGAGGGWEEFSDASWSQIQPYSVMEGYSVISVPMDPDMANGSQGSVVVWITPQDSADSDSNLTNCAASEVQAGVSWVTLIGTSPTSDLVLMKAYYAA